MPPIRLDCVHPPRVRLKPGDVLMVHRELKDKRTGKPFMWKWLGVVTKPLSRNRGAFMIRFGAPEGKDRVAIMFGEDDAVQGVWFLPEEEWPDGVWAFRTKLILEGRLDEAVLG